MRLLVLMPMRDRPEPETAFALEHHMDGLDYRLETTVGLDVVTARNTLWARARSIDADFILCIDADMWWAPGTVSEMIAKAADLQPFDIVGVPYGPKGEMQRWFGIQKPIALRSGLHEVAMVGGGMMLFRRDLLHAIEDPFNIRGIEVLNEPPHPDPHEQFLRLLTITGEDVNFCDRVTEAGGRVLVDTDAIVYHCTRGWCFTPHRLVARIFDFKGNLKNHGMPVHTTTVETIGQRFVSPHGSDYGAGLSLIMLMRLETVARMKGDVEALERVLQTLEANEHPALRLATTEMRLRMITTFQQALRDSRNPRPVKPPTPGADLRRFSIMDRTMFDLEQHLQSVTVLAIDSLHFAPIAMAQPIAPSASAHHRI